MEGDRAIGLEIVLTLSLNMVVKIVLILDQQLRQKSVTVNRVLFMVAIHLGLTFPSVLYHVEAGVRGIGPEIVLTLNPNMVVRIVPILDQQLRPRRVTVNRVLFMVAIHLGLTFPSVLYHVEVGVRGIGPEIVLTLNPNMVVRIVPILDQQLRTRRVTVNRVLFMGAIPLGLTFQNVLYHVEVGVRGIEVEIAQTHSLITADRIAHKLDHR